MQRRAKYIFVCLTNWNLPLILLQLYLVLVFSMHRFFSLLGSWERYGTLFIISTKITEKLKAILNTT